MKKLLFASLLLSMVTIARAQDQNRDEHQGDRNSIGDLLKQDHQDLLDDQAEFNDDQKDMANDQKDLNDDHDDLLNDHLDLNDDHQDSLNDEKEFDNDQGDLANDHKDVEKELPNINEKP